MCLKKALELDFWTQGLMLQGRMVIGNLEM